MCSDSRNNCVLNCSSGYKPSKNIFIKCLCKSGFCFYIRQHVELEAVMELFLTPGFIQRSGFECVKDHVIDVPGKNEIIWNYFEKENQSEIPQNPFPSMLQYPTTSYNCQYLLSATRGATWTCDARVNHCHFRNVI